MKKLGQQEDNILLTTPIESDKMIMGVWNKYFANKHRDIVNNLRAAFQTQPSLHATLTQMFPGFKWPEFADMPTQKSFNALTATVKSLGDVPGVKQSQASANAIKLYMDQYDLLLKVLARQEQGKASKAPETKSTKTPQTQKVKQLQQLLGVNPTGAWDAQSNTTFLNWLKANGWASYITNNRFTGKIDDAIRALLVEKDTPRAQPAGEMADIPQRQAARLERLKKLDK